MSHAGNIALASIALTIGGSASPAAAHPHVWITSHTSVVFSAGSITALQFEWTFDDGYSAMAVEGLDANKDGNYDRQELADLAKVNIDGLKEFDYFTRAAVGDTAVAFAEPTDPWLEYQKGMLTLHFVLPLAQPVAAKGNVFQFALADPSGFIAFEPENVAVSLVGAVPAGCTAGLAGPSPSADPDGDVPVGPPEDTTAVKCSP